MGRISADNGTPKLNVQMHSWLRRASFVRRRVRKLLRGGVYVTRAPAGMTPRSWL